VFNANATKLEIRDSVVVEKKVIVENQEKNKEPIDSVFAKSPLGFIVEELANPSQEVEWIFYSNGDFVLDCVPYDDLDYWYRIGKWNLDNDTLSIFFEKLIFSRGAGELIDVEPSYRFQGGKRHKDYVLTIHLDFEHQKYNWKNYKNNVINKVNSEWRIITNQIPPSRSFSKFNKKLVGDFTELSMDLVDSSYIQKISETGKLSIARNEIFARYGYIFKSEELRNYFSNQEWYSPRYSDVTLYLTDIEKNNIEKILKTEEN
jgi:hypothetical protein